MISLSQGASLMESSFHLSNEIHFRSSERKSMPHLPLRPDIAFSVNKVSQFMHCPLNTHVKAVTRILRYLKGTLTYGMTFKRSSHLYLVGFSDADWGSDPDDRRSMNWYCNFLCCNAVACSPKKQHTDSPI